MHLRRSRAMRWAVPSHSENDNHGHISDTLSISERPACVEERVRYQSIGKAICCAADFYSRLNGKADVIR